MLQSCEYPVTCHFVTIEDCFKNEKAQALRQLDVIGSPTPDRQRRDVAARPLSGPTQPVARHLARLRNRAAPSRAKMTFGQGSGSPHAGAPCQNDPGHAHFEKVEALQDAAKFAYFDLILFAITQPVQRLKVFIALDQDDDPSLIEPITVG